MSAPRLIDLTHGALEASRLEAAAGLMLVPARIEPKFFYDALGSRLFDAITELDEYYPTRTEASILSLQGPAIAAAVIETTRPAPSIVDLGAGNCAKAARLFEAIAPRRYVAIDISVDFLGESLLALQRDHPGIEMVGVGLDFARSLCLPEDIVTGPALVFYPGSSIGNFAPADALRLLVDARRLAGGGAMLIGVDLVKATGLLEAAYDDPLGVTAAFNLNLLRNLNRLVGTDFDPSDWRHVAFFNREQSRIEMHLEARRSLSVCWPGHRRDFAAGERMHTENSYKWTPQAFESLLRQAGFATVRHWTDPAGWFGVFLANG